MPGATPATFQNAQTDTPGRSLRTNVNGTNPNNNNTPHRRREQRQHLAAAPHGLCRAGRDHRHRQHQHQQLRRGAGHGRRRGDHAGDQVGHQRRSGLGVLFPQPGRTERRAVSSIPAKLDSSLVSIGGGTVGGPIKKDKLFFFGVVGRATTSATAAFDTYTVPTAKMRNGDFSEVRRSTRTSGCMTRRTGNADGTGRTQFPSNVIPANRISSIAQHDSGALSRAEQRRHQQRPAEQPVPGAHAEGRPRQLRREVELEPQRAPSDLGQVLDDAGAGRRRVQARVRRRRRRRHQGVCRHGGPHVDAQPDDGARRQLRHRTGRTRRCRPRTSGPTSAPTCSAFPGTNGPDIRGRAACRRSRAGARRAIGNDDDVDAARASRDQLHVHART